jgi:molybdopterin converting factor small subunit
MKVKVHAPAFCSFEHIDENGYMILPEKATLNDVYKKVRVPLPFRKLLFSAVNYRRVKLNTKLNDGDVVSFLTPLSGG